MNLKHCNLAPNRLFRLFCSPKVYIVSFRTHDDRRPSKFIVLADNMKSAIKTAWEHGGAGLLVAVR